MPLTGPFWNWRSSSWALAGGMRQAFPPLLQGRSDAERQQWARWVLGSHSDQFIPEMVAAANQLDKQDPIAYGEPIVNLAHGPMICW